MRYLLCLIPVIAFAQDPGRDERQERLDKAYRMDETREACTKDPDSEYVAEVDGQPIPVDCIVWYRWWEAEERKKKGG